jgi:tetratricopeptide (TPR) repeat protein
MQVIRLTRLGRPAVVDKDDVSSAFIDDARLIDLSSWMMVLGTIRLVCALADYASAFLETAAGQTVSSRLLTGFVQESNPVFTFGLVWPLFLGVALRKTLWPELLKAAAATFLILSVGGMLGLVAEWSHTRGMVLTLGSFHLPRRAIAQPSFSEAVLGFLGATQLVLELGVAMWALFLAARFGRLRSTDADKQQSARRARSGRLAFLLSLAFLVLVIRQPVWSAYLEVLNQSAFVRELVLRNDMKRIHGRNFRRTVSTETAAERAVRELYTAGTTAWHEGLFAAAKDRYKELITATDSIPEGSWPAALRYTIANGFNNFAWLLSTCPTAELRDPSGAVKYAKRAVELAPSDGNCWNTLGVSYYRAGEWEAAKNALYRSMELRGEGDSYDWFFLAMVHFRMGHNDRAHDWNARAVARFRQFHQFDQEPYRSQAEELHRFEVEAADLMGLPKPAPLPPPAPATASSRSSGGTNFPFPLRGRARFGPMQSPPVMRPGR